MIQVPKLKLKRNCDRRLRNGHLWVFSNELEKVPKFESGSLVEILNQENRIYGLAFYNPQSLISARLLLTSDSNLKSVISNRIEKAISLRNEIYPNEECVRLIFGESDLLPGLIVDKFENYLCVQHYSAGMDRNKVLINDILKEHFPDLIGIIEKNTSSLRLLEGLEQNEAVLWGNAAGSVNTSENGIKLILDLFKGQKTGYFLDQKDNRKYIQTISKNKKVLDCFCNLGGFALNAAAGGAESALGLDVSEAAVDSAISNAKINNFRNVNFLKADVFDFLENCTESYDIIILDPPAFAKSKKVLATALKGYAKINRLALKLIPDDGYLVSSSCSQHVDESEFLNLISNEAAKQSIQLKLIYRGAQSQDHPVLSSMPETRYLKFFVFKISR
ncbi:MAG: class I SAM-dependent rRNA methyltransferase [Candidatus Kapabacteria bacterium]|nr:class I SAM-dependent rRNA methyltransferase [Candidatus Kapabacteria bacterium]